MTIQAKVTLRYGLLVVFMVGAISTVNVAVETGQQFASLLERAREFDDLAVSQLTELVKADPSRPLDDVVNDPTLSDMYREIMLKSKAAVIQLALVDEGDTILVDSIPDAGNVLPKYEDFGRLIEQTNWLQKLRILWRGTTYYQVESPPQLTPTGKLLYVRAVINPSLIRQDIQPHLTQNLTVAVIAILGAVFLTILFSAIAFRPLGRLRRQLEMVAAGDYDSGVAPSDGSGSSKHATDEFAIMTSKVNLLGERLRGAQFEVSDLRGNVERLFQDLEDAVFLFNREQRLVFASGSVEKLFRRARHDLAGHSLAEIFPPSGTLGLLIADAVASGKPVRNRRTPVTSEAEIPADAPTVLLSVDLIQAAPGGGGSGLLVRLRDPEAQRKIGRQLQIADRLAAISRISGGVAHEVKNPLNAILLHVEVARAKLAAGDTDVEPQMDIIAREILRLDRVVKTFLDFTRPVELHLAVVPLDALVSEIVELARPQADAGAIRITVRPRAEGVEVRIDRDLFKQAVLNVVVNAMQAMPGGGELCFESSATAEAAEIRISDTGPGIPAELRDKIFRLYFTTRKEGSGIGLAMTFRIVQLHDGTIDFTSDPGTGTTFLIRLPVVTGQE
jgi:signal transduction histidine kinase